MNQDNYSRGHKEFNWLILLTWLAVAFAALLLWTNRHIEAEDVRWSADDPTVPEDPPPPWVRNPRGVDLTAKPTAPRIWMAMDGSKYRVDEHRADRVKFAWDQEKVQLYQVPEQQQREVSGLELLAGIHRVESLNANVLDWLLAHEETIPASWRDKYVIFGGTVYRTPMVPPRFYLDEPLSFFKKLKGSLKGVPVVRAMYYNGPGKYAWTWYVLNEREYFDDKYYIAAFK